MRKGRRTRAKQADVSIAAIEQAIGLPRLGRAPEPIDLLAFPYPAITVDAPEDWRQDVVRPARVLGNPRAGLLVGNPAAAQEIYLHFARVAIQLAELGDETADVAAAEDVRQAIGAPVVLEHKPRNVISDLGNLPLFPFVDGIREALLSDNCNWLNKDDPYHYIWRAARGILWNRMRAEDRKITTLYAGPPLEDDMLVVKTSTRRMELLRDIEQELEPLKKRNPDLYRLLKIYAAAADDESAVVDRGVVARRYRVLRARLGRLLLHLEHRHGGDLDSLWQALGGYVMKREIQHDRDGKPRFAPERKSLR